MGKKKKLNYFIFQDRNMKWNVGSTPTSPIWIFLLGMGIPCDSEEEAKRERDRKNKETFN